MQDMLRAQANIDPTALAAVVDLAAVGLTRCYGTTYVQFTGMPKLV